MKAPVKLAQPVVIQELSTPPAGRRRAATGRRRTRTPATRPRTRVPGGKALARINYFHLERGGVPDTLLTRPAAAALSQPVRAVEASSPAANLVAGFHASRAQMAAAVPVAQTWQPLGPFHMPHGQTYGGGPGSRPPVAGRVAAIAVDPSNAAHILLGSAGGGVWESTDTGQTWLSCTDDQPSLAIGALAFDPSNPLRVFAGTGEGNVATEADANVRAAGFLTSVDGGKTWAAIPGTPFLGVSCYKLLVDPADGNHLLAATTNGLFETVDGGAAWNRRRSTRTWDVSKHPEVPTNPVAGREVLIQQPHRIRFLHVSTLRSR